jgi:hypothetical protein
VYVRAIEEKVVMGGLNVDLPTMQFSATSICLKYAIPTIHKVIPYA